MHAYWISKGVKHTGSMVIHLANERDAQKAVDDGMVKIGGNIALVNEFHRILRPQRCFQCNEYGHLRARCTKAITCGKCSGGHETDKCTIQEHKCPACGGPHTVRDANCPVYQREKERLRNASNPTQETPGQETGWQTVVRNQRRDTYMHNA